MTKTKLRPAVQTQLTTFFDYQSISSQRHYYTHDSKLEIAKYFRWAAQFTDQYLISRQERADDLGTVEIAKAQKLARSYIGENQHDFFATCVDGRNMPTVMFSKPPHVGGVLRSPAGAVTGFMEGQQPGSVFIDWDSYVVKRVSKLIEEKANEVIFYGLDSHLGCAARGLIHSTEGGKQKDQGLRSDVMSKIMTAKGLLTLRETLQQKKGQVAQLIPTFFSYDPHLGGVIMGLEMHVNDPRVVTEGFTPEILDQLAKEGKIVRSFDLLLNEVVLSELKQKVSQADFRNRFSDSMLSNWKAITKIYASGESKVYALLLDTLTKAYKKSGWKVENQDDLSAFSISKNTMRQKAKFLLKNLVTRYSIAQTNHTWPYDSHREDLTVVTDGGYAPFSSLNAFAVFSRDLNALLPNTKLTIDLIRQFRKSGNAQNPVVEYEFSTDEFVSAPVVIVNKAIFRNVTESEWQVLAKIDFSEVFSTINWDDVSVLNWGKEDVSAVVVKALGQEKLMVKMSTSLDFLEVIYELFDRFRIMMRDKYFRQMIVFGKIIVIHAIMDRDRGPRLILPFVV